MIKISSQWRIFRSSKQFPKIVLGNFKTKKISTQGISPSYQDKTNKQRWEKLHSSEIKKRAPDLCMTPKKCQKLWKFYKILNKNGLTKQVEKKKCQVAWLGKLLHWASTQSIHLRNLKIDITCIGTPRCIDQSQGQIQNPLFASHLCATLRHWVEFQNLRCLGNLNRQFHTRKLNYWWNRFLQIKLRKVQLLEKVLIGQFQNPRREPSQNMTSRSYKCKNIF